MGIGLFARVARDVRLRAQGPSDAALAVSGRSPRYQTLYYFRGDEMFLFASEIRALLATERIPWRLDPAGLASYLAFGSVQAPCAIVRGIHCMRSGTYAVI